MGTLLSQNARDVIFGRPLLQILIWKCFQGGSLLDYFALPATKLILSYVQFRPRLLEEKGFLKRLQIWPSFCRMLNDLSSSLAETQPEFSADVREKFPLPEEFGLQAFLPLNDSLQGYNFKMVRQARLVLELNCF